MAIVADDQPRELAFLINDRLEEGRFEGGGVMLAGHECVAFYW